MKDWSFPSGKKYKNLCSCCFEKYDFWSDADCISKVYRLLYPERLTPRFYLYQDEDKEIFENPLVIMEINRLYNTQGQSGWWRTGRSGCDIHKKESSSGDDLSEFDKLPLWKEKYFKGKDFIYQFPWAYFQKSATKIETSKTTYFVLLNKKN